MIELYRYRCYTDLALYASHGNPNCIVVDDIAVELRADLPMAVDIGHAHGLRAQHHCDHQAKQNAFI